MKKSLIRSSEIAEYVFCPYSWYLNKEYGKVPTGRQIEKITGGTIYHEKVTKSVEDAIRLRTYKYWYIFALLIIFVVIGVLLVYAGAF